MTPFYFKFQFRNVEYSSGRNKTLLCYRVDTPGGTTEPLKGYMEDEHATAHAEEAFFQQVMNWGKCYIQGGNFPCALTGIYGKLSKCWLHNVMVVYRIMKPSSFTLTPYNLIITVDYVCHIQLGKRKIDGRVKSVTTLRNKNNPKKV